MNPFSVVPGLDRIASHFAYRNLWFLVRSKVSCFKNEVINTKPLSCYDGCCIDHESDRAYVFTGNSD